MEFLIEANGRETTVSIQKGFICYEERKQLEIDYWNQVMRGLQSKRTRLSSNVFPTLMRLLTNCTITSSFETGYIVTTRNY